jgi:hypothetical protein
MCAHECAHRKACTAACTSNGPMDPTLQCLLCWAVVSFEMHDKCMTNDNCVGGWLPGRAIAGRAQGFPPAHAPGACCACCGCCGAAGCCAGAHAEPC